MVSFDEVIGAPFDGIHTVPQLTNFLHLWPIFDHTPWQHGNGERHGQPEFHIVTCIVVSPNQIYLHQSVAHQGLIEHMYPWISPSQKLHVQ